MSTMSEYLATGTGGIELRVAVEGCPLEFCTSHLMAGVLSAFGGLEGVRRVGGLRREGLSFQESVYLPGADYRAALGSVSVEDTDESVAWNTRAASSVFSKLPRELAYLRASVDATETEWTVNSTDDLTAGDVVHVDTEAVRVESVDDATTITVTRGVWRTTGQAHFVAVSSFAGDRTQICAIFNAPPTYRRRRVWIYGHGVSELGLATSGTLVARAVISGAPSLTDAMTWGFSLASLASLFDSDVGPREGAGVLTGIYYPGAAPYRFSVYRRAGDSVTTDIADTTTVVIAGRWTTQAAFCETVTTTLNTRLVSLGWDESFSARPVGNGWELYVRTAGSGSQKHVACWGGSVIDGFFNGEVYGATDVGLTAFVGTIDHSTEYRCGWFQTADPDAGWSPPAEGVRLVPRGTHYAWAHIPGTAADIIAYPWHRVYVSSAAGIAAGDLIRVTQGPISGGYEYAWEAVVTDVDPDTGAITWDPDTMRRMDGAAVYTGGVYSIWTVVTPASLPSITLLRDLGTGHVGDMLASVAALAPALANAGTLPFILEADFDFDFAAINAAVIEASAGRSWLLSRRYVFASSVSFSDLIKHELRLLGAFFATTETGALTIRPLVPRLDADDTIAASDLVIDDGFGELVVEPDGVLTGLDIKTGYDSIEDEHKGPTTLVVALGALAAQRTFLALEIAPKSTASGTEPLPEELASHCYGKVSLWSRLRFAVTVSVIVTHHDTLIGDTVYCTIPQLPYDGERSIDAGGGGMVAVRGTVTGRSWRFDEPSVSLTILFDSITVSGYAPTGRVLSQTGATTTWTLTLDADEYGPGDGTLDADFFATGFAVRLIEWDVQTPTIVTGTVTGTSGNDVSIETDATWTPGTSTWNLVFAQSTSSDIVEAQLRYAFVARDDWRVHLASGSRRAATFSP